MSLASKLELRRESPLGDATLPASAFDHILEADRYDFPLFGAPRPSVSDAEYSIGLRCAALVPDGGTLQIGIGSIGDAVAYGLCLRQQNNGVFRETLERLGGDPRPD